MPDRGLEHAALMGEGQEPRLAMIGAIAGRADAAKGQVLDRQVQKRVPTKAASCSNGKLSCLRFGQRAKNTKCRKADVRRRRGRKSLL